ncbi:hypothetical protein [Sutcliffiella horikoshii]|uniref:Uncharacterized protein n=1 Tax=Sutcliffiella horikoshii TaxID=79883 RepID=A0A5D4TCE3_9BACI|nr:hypothetical protein [Sutcliffiella horikoshii]TYS72408.1 hypothetical protein FZC75_10690 [Sutcliffiella horikoshii]
MKKNIFIASIVFLISITFFVQNTNAATGYEGYAVYRDGSTPNYDWHAGLMDEPYNTNYLPVLHHSGNGYVKWDSWSGFLNGESFKGVYRPKGAPTSSQRDAFVAMGRNLRSENIPYNLIYQVYYDRDTTGKYVYASDITSIRCDGVVEYVYEFYYFRVHGSNSDNWDVSVNDYWIRDHHSYPAVTPKKQISNMVFVSSRADGNGTIN